VRSVRVEPVNLVREVIVVYEIGWAVGVEQVAIYAGSAWQAHNVSGLQFCFREEAEEAEGAGGVGQSETERNTETEPTHPDIWMKVFVPPARRNPSIIAFAASRSSAEAALIVIYPWISTDKSSSSSARPHS
jgi:hypothetical protein